MKAISLVFALLLFAMASAAQAEDEPFDDIENVKTPLSLPDLLPEGGVDAVDVDYWIQTKSLKNGRPWGSDSITRWTIKPKNGQLVFKSDAWYYGRSNYRRIKTTTYSGQGKLQSYQYLYYSRGRKIMFVEGEVEDDELVLKTTQYDNEGNVRQVNRKKTLSLEPYENSIPSEWQPLVFAYHIQKGSLGYRFDRADVSRSNRGDSNIFEDVGTEQVEFHGKQATAHLLVGKRDDASDSRSKQPAMVKYLVLPNGLPMSIRIDIGEHEYISKRITAEQAKKKLPIDDAVAED